MDMQFQTIHTDQTTAFTSDGTTYIACVEMATDYKVALQEIVNGMPSLSDVEAAFVAGQTEVLNKLIDGGTHMGELYLMHREAERTANDPSRLDREAAFFLFD